MESSTASAGEQSEAIMISDSAIDKSFFFILILPSDYVLLLYIINNQMSINKNNVV